MLPPSCFFLLTLDPDSNKLSTLRWAESVMGGKDGGSRLGSVGASTLMRGGEERSRKDGKQDTRDSREQWQ